ncbi:hypothetical protein MBANPS3_000510 [Mucor bainieri]
MRSYDSTIEDCKSSTRDIFPRYFELHSKDRAQLSATETATLSFTLKYFNDIKSKLTSYLDLSLKSCQIVVGTPQLIEWDISLLRALFLETGWITAKDGDSKLMLVPFIEACVNAFQVHDMRKEQLQREGKYMMMYMQPAKEEGKVCYTSVCFQLRCAKELIGVSKRLAFSDFLLVPSIIGNNYSICLPTMDEAMLVAIVNIMKKIRNRHKTQLYGINKEDELSESEVAKIAIEFITESRRRRWDFNEKISTNVRSFDYCKYQLQGLGEYQTQYFLMNLTQDANIQHHTKLICDFLQESLNTTGMVKDAPDGIRRIILCLLIDENDIHRFCIEKALLKAKLINPEEKFTLVTREEGVLHRPSKIAQVANAFLPPLVLDEDKSDEVVTLTNAQQESSIFLPLNSFYLQANISQRQINFILNKVVKESTTKTPAKLFTTEERTVEIDDIQITTSDNLWSQYQLLDSKGFLYELVSSCQKHQDITLLLGHYQCFVENFFTQLRDNSSIPMDALDVYHLISICRDCACALKISHRMLLETGLKPAISGIAKTIIGTTLSEDYFGLYPISAIFVKRDVSYIDNEYYSGILQCHLEERLSKFFKNHQLKLATIFVDKKPKYATRQYLVKGKYKQITNSTYTISMMLFTDRHPFSYGILDNCSSVYTNIGGSYVSGRNWNVKYAFKTEYTTILNQEEDIPRGGCRSTFFLPKCKAAVVCKVFLFKI